MPLFRKKPVVIEAVLFDGNLDKLRSFGVPLGSAHRLDVDQPWVTVGIETLEGMMLANRGDWIIKDVHGEFYPCKPDIFEETYEPAL